MADAADSDPRDEIDVLIAVFVIEHRAAPARHGEPRVLGERLKAGRYVTLLLLDDLP
jgi:hypothetical protein